MNSKNVSKNTEKRPKETTGGYMRGDKDYAVEKNWALIKSITSPFKKKNMPHTKISS